MFIPVGEKVLLFLFVLTRVGILFLLYLAAPFFVGAHLFDEIGSAARDAWLLHDSHPCSIYRLDQGHHQILFLGQAVLEGVQNGDLVCQSIQTDVEQQLRSLDLDPNLGKQILEQQGLGLIIWRYRFEGNAITAGQLSFQKPDNYFLVGRVSVLSSDALVLPEEVLVSDDRTASLDRVIPNIELLGGWPSYRGIDALSAVKAYLWHFLTFQYCSYHDAFFNSYSFRTSITPPLPQRFSLSSSDDSEDESSEPDPVSPGLFFEHGGIVQDEEEGQGGEGEDQHTDDPDNPFHRSSNLNVRQTLPQRKIRKKQKSIGASLFPVQGRTQTSRNEEEFESILVVARSTSQERVCAKWGGLVEIRQQEGRTSSRRDADIWKMMQLIDHRSLTDRRPSATATLTNSGEAYCLGVDKGKAQPFRCSSKLQGIKNFVKLVALVIRSLVKHLMSVSSGIVWFGILSSNSYDIAHVTRKNENSGALLEFCELYSLSLASGAGIVSRESENIANVGSIDGSSSSRNRFTFTANNEGSTGTSLIFGVIDREWMLRPKSSDILCFAGKQRKSLSFVLDLIRMQAKPRFFGYLLERRASTANDETTVDERILWLGGFESVSAKSHEVEEEDRWITPTLRGFCLFCDPTHFRFLSCGHHLRIFSRFLWLYVMRIHSFLECFHEQATSLSLTYATLSLAAFGDSTLTLREKVKKTARCNNYKLQSFRYVGDSVPGTGVVIHRSSSNQLPDLGRAYYMNLLLLQTQHHFGGASQTNFNPMAEQGSSLEEVKPTDAIASRSTMNPIPVGSVVGVSSGMISSNAPNCSPYGTSYNVLENFRPVPEAFGKGRKLSELRRMALFVTLYDPELNKKGTGSVENSWVFDHDFEFIQGRKQIVADLRVLPSSTSSTTIVNKNTSTKKKEQPLSSFLRERDAFHGTKLNFPETVNEIQNLEQVFKESETENRIFGFYNRLPFRNYGTAGMASFPKWILLGYQIENIEKASNHNVFVKLHSEIHTRKELLPSIDFTASRLERLTELFTFLISRRTTYAQACSSWDYQAAADTAYPDRRYLVFHLDYQSEKCQRYVSDALLELCLHVPAAVIDLNAAKNNARSVSSSSSFVLDHKVLIVVVEPNGPEKQQLQCRVDTSNIAIQKAEKVIGKVFEKVITQARSRIWRRHFRYEFLNGRLVPRLTGLAYKMLSGAIQIHLNDIVEANCSRGRDYILIEGRKYISSDVQAIASSMSMVRRQHQQEVSRIPDHHRAAMIGLLQSWHEFSQNLVIDPWSLGHFSSTIDLFASGTVLLRDPSAVLGKSTIFHAGDSIKKIEAEVIGEVSPYICEIDLEKQTITAIESFSLSSTSLSSSASSSSSTAPVGSLCSDRSTTFIELSLAIDMKRRLWKGCTSGDVLFSTFLRNDLPRNIFDEINHALLITPRVTNFDAHLLWCDRWKIQNVLQRMPVVSSSTDLEEEANKIQKYFSFAGLNRFALDMVPKINIQAGRSTSVAASSDDGLSVSKKEIVGPVRLSSFNRLAAETLRVVSTILQGFHRQLWSQSLLWLLGRSALPAYSPLVYFSSEYMSKMIYGATSSTLMALTDKGTDSPWEQFGFRPEEDSISRASSLDAFCKQWQLVLKPAEMQRVLQQKLLPIGTEVSEGTATVIFPEKGMKYIHMRDSFVLEKCGAFLFGGDDRDTTEELHLLMKQFASENGFPFGVILKLFDVRAEPIWIGDGRQGLVFHGLSDETDWNKNSPATDSTARPLRVRGWDFLRETDTLPSLTDLNQSSQKAERDSSVKKQKTLALQDLLSTSKRENSFSYAAIFELFQDRWTSFENCLNIDPAFGGTQLQNPERRFSAFVGSVLVPECQEWISIALEQYPELVECGNDSTEQSVVAIKSMKSMEIHYEALAIDEQFSSSVSDEAIAHLIYSQGSPCKSLIDSDDMSTLSGNIQWNVLANADEPLGEWFSTIVINRFGNLDKKTQNELLSNYLERLLVQEEDQSSMSEIVHRGDIATVELLTLRNVPGIVSTPAFGTVAVSLTAKSNLARSAILKYRYKLYPILVKQVLGLNTFEQSSFCDGCLSETIINAGRPDRTVDPIHFLAERSTPESSSTLQVTARAEAFPANILRLNRKLLDQCRILESIKTIAKAYSIAQYQTLWRILSSSHAEVSAEPESLSIDFECVIQTLEPASHGPWRVLFSMTNPVDVPENELTHLVFVDGDSEQVWQRPSHMAPHKFVFNTDVPDGEHDHDTATLSVSGTRDGGRMLFRIYNNRGELFFLSSDNVLAERGFFIAIRSNDVADDDDDDNISSSTNTVDLSRLDVTFARDVFTPLLHRMRREMRVAQRCAHAEEAALTSQVSAAFFRFLIHSRNSAVLPFYPSRERPVCLEAKLQLLIGLLESAIVFRGVNSVIGTRFAAKKEDIQQILNSQSTADTPLFAVHLEYEESDAIDLTGENINPETYAAHLVDIEVHKSTDQPNHSATIVSINLLRDTFIALFGRYNMHETVELTSSVSPKPWNGCTQPRLSSSASTSTPVPYWSSSIIHTVALPCALVDFEIQIIFSREDNLVDIVKDPGTRYAVAIFGGTSFSGLTKFHEDIGSWHRKNLPNESENLQRKSNLSRSPHQKSVSHYVYRQWSLVVENISAVIEHMAAVSSSSDEHGRSSVDVRFLQDERSSGIVEVFGAKSRSLFMDVSGVFPTRSNLAEEYALYFDPVHLRAQVLIVAKDAEEGSTQSHRQRKGRTIVPTSKSVLHCDIDSIMAKDYLQHFGFNQSKQKRRTDIPFLTQLPVTFLTSFHLLRQRRFQPRCKQNPEERKNFLKLMRGRTSAKSFELISTLAAIPHVFTAFYYKARDYEICSKEYPLFKYQKPATGRAKQGGSFTGGRYMVVVGDVEKQWPSHSVAALCAEWKLAHVKHVSKEVGLPLFGSVERTSRINSIPSSKRSWSIHIICGGSCFGVERVISYPVIFSDRTGFRSPKMEQSFGAATPALHSDANHDMIFDELVSRLRTLVRNFCGPANFHGRAQPSSAVSAYLEDVGSGVDFGQNQGLSDDLEIEKDDGNVILTDSGEDSEHEKEQDHDSEPNFTNFGRSINSVVKSSKINRQRRPPVVSFHCPEAFKSFPFYSMFLSHDQLRPEIAEMFESMKVVTNEQRLNAENSHGSSIRFEFLFKTVTAADNFEKAWNAFIGVQKRNKTILFKELDTAFLKAVIRLRWTIIVMASILVFCCALCFLRRWIKTRTRAKVKLAQQLALWNDGDSFFDDIDIVSDKKRSAFSSSDDDSGHIQHHSGYNHYAEGERRSTNIVKISNKKKSSMALKTKTSSSVIPRSQFLHKPATSYTDSMPWTDDLEDTFTDTSCGGSQSSLPVLFERNTAQKVSRKHSQTPTEMKTLVRESLWKNRTTKGKFRAPGGSTTQEDIELQETLRRRT